MSVYVHKKHNVSVLLYHLVCPAKYRRVVFTEDVGRRYEMSYIEIGTDEDHVHFLIQTVPMYSPSRLSQIVKSITAREVFRRVPEVKKNLWGGEFWRKGYFINTVGKHGNEDAIRNYVRAQGQEAEYKQLHWQQLDLFES
ncbi:MAG: IS200/IS605 family transposase [Thermodesulfovibrionales bacterium]